MASSEFEQWFTEIGYPTLSEHHGDPVEYVCSTGLRITFTAPVREAQHDDLEKIPGQRGQRGVGGILVAVPRAKVTTIRLKDDRLLWDRKVYVVTLLLHTTRTNWHVFAQPPKKGS